MEGCDPLHTDAFHNIVFGTEEETVDGGDPEYEAAKTVVDRYVSPACEDLEEEPREGEDEGHGAAEDADEQSEE